MRSFCLSLLVLHFSILAYSQCISTYPYTENFEATNGTWVSGGAGNDWIWGLISKPQIAQAASGNNCWVTGGLTNSFYSFGQRSYSQSPCFDFSSLLNPYISFNIYWEAERGYDGATFQSSIDGGTTWQNVGSSSDLADCNLANWFNISNVTNLTGLAAPKEGWSGNVQQTSGSCQGGSGSNGWKLAKHCMSNLAGQPNVIFRLAFGSGTTCNDYDGFAFDDVTIGEAPAPVVDFTSVCNGSTITFTGNYTLCPNQFSWLFGDGNTGTGLTVSHNYTGTGNYNVTFTAGGGCGSPANITKLIQTITATASGIDVSCNGGNNGNAFVTAAGGSNYTYTWNTSPAQTTDTAFNLAAGTYNVTISAPNFCDVTASVTVSQPAFISSSFAIGADTCRTSVGSITASPNGGNLPYSFTWSNGGTGNSIAGLAEGNYTVTITDAAGCSVSADAFVPYVSGINLVLNKENVSCYGSADGQITVTATGGTLPYTYLWSNSNNTLSINRLNEGSYTITISDANNCTATDSAIVYKDVCPSYIYFPTAFSPNGDGANDFFKPKYSIDLRKYFIRVYNRWGEEVFETNDVNEGWDGVYQEINQALSVFVWYAEYSFMNGEKHAQSGNVTLVR